METCSLFFFRNKDEIFWLIYSIVFFWGGEMVIEFLKEKIVILFLSEFAHPHPFILVIFWQNLPLNRWLFRTRTYYWIVKNVLHLPRGDSNTCADEYPQILTPENSPSQSNLALTPEPPGWVSSVKSSLTKHEVTGGPPVCFFFIKCDVSLWIVQDEPFVASLSVSLPHAGRRRPVAAEAPLHLHSQRPYGQHSGSVWHQHYRG